MTTSERAIQASQGGPQRRALSEDAVQAAFDYLNNNDENIGLARANERRGQYAIERAERKLKQVAAKLYLKAEGSVETRKAWAITHPDYEKAAEELDAAHEKHAQAIEVWESAVIWREKANLIIESWRSMEASGRQLRQLR